MASKGSSVWNGKYGPEEKRRRENYEKGTEKIGAVMGAYPSEYGQAMREQGYEAEHISDAVPRRKK